MRVLFGPIGASVRQVVLPAKGSAEINRSFSDAEDYEAGLARRTAKKKLFREGKGDGLNNKKAKG